MGERIEQYVKFLTLIVYCLHFLLINKMEMEVSFDQPTIKTLFFKCDTWLFELQIEPLASSDGMQVTVSDFLLSRNKKTVNCNLKCKIVKVIFSMSCIAYKRSLLCKTFIVVFLHSLETTFSIMYWNGNRMK